MRCKGTGKVEGGFKKRIEKETKALEDQRTNQLRNIKEKDRKKRAIIEKEIDDKFDSKLKEKDRESPGFTGRCAYCGGTGSR